MIYEFVVYVKPAQASDEDRILWKDMITAKDEESAKRKILIRYAKQYVIDKQIAIDSQKQFISGMDVDPESSRLEILIRPFIQPQSIQAYIPVYPSPLYYEWVWSYPYRVTYYNGSWNASSQMMISN